MCMYVHIDDFTANWKSAVSLPELLQFAHMTQNVRLCEDFLQALKVIDVIYMPGSCSHTVLNQGIPHGPQAITVPRRIQFDTFSSICHCDKPNHFHCNFQMINTVHLTCTHGGIWMNLLAFIALPLLLVLQCTWNHGR